MTSGWVGRGEWIMPNKERLEQLCSLWWDETNEAWTQKWRNGLTKEEQEIVTGWDNHYCGSVVRLCQRIMDLENLD